MKLILLLAAALLAAPNARADDEPAKAAADAKAAPAEEKPAAADAAPAKEAAPEKAGRPAAKSGAKKSAGPGAAGGGGAAKAGDDRAYVDAAVAFLKAYAHSSRKGDQGAQAWEALKEHAGDKVAVKIGGKEHDLDVAGKKSDARLLKFAKIATWREGEHIKGVTVDVLEFKIGKDEHKTKGTVAMSEKDGKWVVDSVDAD